MAKKKKDDKVLPLALMGIGLLYGTVFLMHKMKI